MPGIGRLRHIYRYQRHFPVHPGQTVQPGGQKPGYWFASPAVGGEKGSADTERDPRGFAVKFYTGMAIGTSWVTIRRSSS